MKKEYNYALALLRSLMCFFVILRHCYSPASYNALSNIFCHTREFEAPVFMVMSFFLVGQSLINPGPEAIKKRMSRLLLPQLAWALIYFLFYFLFNLAGLMDTRVKVTDLLWQMLLGHSPALNETMWYQTDLIVITLIFILITRLFKKRYRLILLCLGLAALIFQYTGANMVFDSFITEARNPLGRLAEMLPLAVIGFLLGCYPLLALLKSKWYFTEPVILLFIGLLAKFDIFPDCPGYGYQGLSVTFSAALFLIFAYCLPLEGLSEAIKKAITSVTAFTMGIYCMHRLIATIFNILISRLNIGITVNSFIYCILIYLVCFLICLAIAKPSGKSKWASLIN